MYNQIIAVDFDGTLCENKWPEIGEPNTELIGYLIMMQKTVGAKIILWTCRIGEMLDRAVNDLSLMKRLRNAGTDHRKFMRMITVYVDILAPLYW